jgi:site-specific DNA-methyltransferase (adenine-specific)
MLIRADARLIPLRDACVQTVVTSPPYWGGLRDYGNSRQLGLERQPADYVMAMVDVFREVRRVLRPDGTLWLNLGDVYAASGKGGGGTARRSCWDTVRERKGFRMPPPGFKMKDLTLVPFLLASALREDGWYLRSTIVWRKSAAVEPMRRDRPAVSHEYLFLLALAEIYQAENPGEPWWGHSVWDIRSDANGTHPAIMPRELVRRCIAVSSRPGQLVLDPFIGSGTVGLVAEQQNRRWVGLDLEYQELAAKRTSQRSLVIA